MPEWIVSLPDRLDSFLATSGATLSRARAQKAIEEGRVTVNDDVVTKASERLQEGDKVVLTELDVPTDAGIVPVNLHFEVLYEDDACAVILKPAGIAVHPGAGMVPNEQTILHGAAYLFEKWRLPFSANSVLVHRLDKDTTGCLLLAKTPAAHIALQKQFETRTVDKRYLALVAGTPSPAAATVDSPIGRSGADPTRMDIVGAGASRDAKTTYQMLGAAKTATGTVALLECTLHTGRTHQIRVHLSAIGHPVLGDGTYTSDLSVRLADELGIRSLCLHAWKLTFTSPADKKKHAVLAPVPEALQYALKRVDIRLPA